MGTHPLLDELDGRGLVHDSTDRDALAARLAEGPITLYCGFDPTADSLHVGHLVPLLMLRRFLDAGHRPIALAGGATGMVGDPSGRSSERNLLDASTLAANVAAIKEQLTTILGAPERREAGGGDSWLLEDNARWSGDVGLLDFLRDVGKYVTVNQMVAKESVKARMESENGISFTEFSYMLLQAYDFLVLHRDPALGCELQIGGSDQWGNITLGIDLIRRHTGRAAYGLTCPLIVRSDGKKFGKSEEGNVWLSGERTSPYQFFQYFINVPDADVGRFLRLFTFLPLDEIAAVEEASAADPGARIGQRTLARDLTATVHGAAAAAAAEEASTVLFGGSPLSASPAAFELLAGEVPTTGLDTGATAVDLALAAALVSSKSDGRRAVDQGGLYLNGERLTEDRSLAGADLVHGRYALLRRGKNKYALVVAPPGRSAVAVEGGAAVL
jgi:tyrosyl-tRNA synthetase